MKRKGIVEMNAKQYYMLTYKIDDGEHEVHNAITDKSLAEFYMEFVSLRRIDMCIIWSTPITAEEYDKLTYYI